MQFSLPEGQENKIHMCRKHEKNKMKHSQYNMGEGQMKWNKDNKNID